jgi:hypothetical protein
MNGSAWLAAGRAAKFERGTYVGQALIATRGPAEL